MVRPCRQPIRITTSSRHKRTNVLSLTSNSTIRSGHNNLSRTIHNTHLSHGNRHIRVSPSPFNITLTRHRRTNTNIRSRSRQGPISLNRRIGVPIPTRQRISTHNTRSLLVKGGLTTRIIPRTDTHSRHSRSRPPNRRTTRNTTQTTTRLSSRRSTRHRRRRRGVSRPHPIVTRSAHFPITNPTKAPNTNLQ